MKHNYTQVVVTEAFLALPEIKQLISKHKYLGFSIVVFIQLELSKYKHAIGRISNLRRTSHDIGIQLKTLLNIMDDSCAFVMDYEHDIYYMPRLRKKLHLPVDLTNEEIKDICSNGNVYFGYGEKKTESHLSCSNKNENNQRKISKRFQIVNTQDADKEEDSNLAYKDKGISLKGRNKDINKNKDASRCSDDDAAVNEIKEILSSPSWCNSVKKRHGIDLKEKITLGVFAQWLYTYCCANDKMQHSDSDLRQYANNLLRKGTRTRAEFDRFYEDEMNDIAMQNAEIQNENIQTNYEHIDNGIRMSCFGQVIPDDAPKQPSPYTAYSYIQDKWIPEKDYDAIPETIAFDKHMAQNPAYVKQWKGEA